MCSLAGEVMLEEKLDLKRKGIDVEKCKKCLTEKPAVLLRKKDAYCKSCFLQGTTHKFRSAVGKYRISKNERVIILYRIGHPSSALLHLVKMGLEQPQHKKLRLEPMLLYIDDNYKLSTEERLNLCKQVMKEIVSYKFPVYFSVLNKIKNDCCPYVEFMDDSHYKNFEDLIKSTENKYGRNTDFVNILRRNILINIGKDLNCKYAFTYETNGDAAVKLLSCVANGRGLQLSLEAGECDDRDPSIKIIQPLRYFEIKELAFYNIFNNISPVVAPHHNYSDLYLSNVDKLLSTFVHDLQENYPSTVNTVVRTGDKLTCEKSDYICRICKAPIEMQEDLCSSEASKFSHWISINARNFQNENLSSFLIECDNTLCYACERNQL